MPKLTRAKTHAKAENESLAGVPLDGLPQEAVSVMAWQAKEMPDLFRQAFPEAASLQLRDRVLAKLLEIILAGQLHQPGKLASEVRVANLLSKRLNQKISRTPLREALAILVRDGFVRQLPQKGFEVVEVSADETREVLSLCGEVEALAIERLITTDRPTDLEPLRAAQRHLARATERNDHRNWMLGDTAFHVGLAQCAGLKDAALSIERWRQKVHLYSRTHFEAKMADTAAAVEEAEPEAEGVYIIPDWDRKLMDITGEEGSRARPIADARDAVMPLLSQEHDEIVQAITNRQADRAVELLDQHLEYTTVWLGLSDTTLAIPVVTPIPAERIISEQEPDRPSREITIPEELAEAAKGNWPEELLKRALTLGAQPETLLTQIESGIRADQAERFIAQQEGMREADAT